MSKVYSIKDITNYENHIGYDLRTPDGKDIRFSDNIEHNPFMYNEIKEIKLEKRKPTFDYILNDLAFDSLMFRVVNGIGSSQDKFDFDYQVKLMQKEKARLNNVINELEKFFKYEYDNEVRPLNDRKISVWTICLDKLKKLKEGDKDE